MEASNYEISKDKEIIVVVDSGIINKNEIFKITTSKNIIFETFKNTVYNCIVDGCSQIKKLKIKDIFLTLDQEGKISPGNYTRKLGDIIKNNQPLYVKYYMGGGLWTTFLYEDISTKSCKYCGMITNNLINISNSWTLEQLCNNCYKRVPKIIKDKDSIAIHTEGDIIYYCFLCGNKGVYIGYKSERDDFFYGKCKGKCLSPQERQCGNCGIPVEFVDLCKICKKCYCSDKCREEAKHECK
jgi:hypothetical protein